MKKSILQQRIFSIYIFTAYLCLIFLSSTSLAQTINYENYTRLIAYENVTVENDQRIPLILVHGTHGNEWNGHDGVNDPNFSYWKGIQDFFYSNKTLRTNYKLYGFWWEGDRIESTDVAKGFAYWVDQRTAQDKGTAHKLKDEPFVILAHSMGGLISRAFLNETLSEGNWAGKQGGNRILSLITLATPHHGSPGANGEEYKLLLDECHGCLCDELKFDWKDVLDKVGTLFVWKNKVLGRYINVYEPNRNALLWDNYNGSMNGCNETNVLLPWMDSTFYHKIIAYAGVLPFDDEERPKKPLDVLSLFMSTTGITLGSDWDDGIDFDAEVFWTNDHEKLLASSAALYEAILSPGEYAGSQTDVGANDGMVPLNSALFEGSIEESQQRPVLVGYDHAHMKGDDMPNDDLTDMLEEDLLSLAFGFTTIPEEIYAPTQVTFNPKGAFTAGTTYTWGVDYDGTLYPLTGQTPTFVFRKPGNYDVTMTAIDPSAGTITRTQTVSVYSPQIEEQHPGGIASMFRTFSTIDSPYVTQYAWSFGDGETGPNQAAANHTYEITGNYDITLTLTLDDDSTISSQLPDLFVGPGTRYIKGHTIYGGQTEAWLSGGIYVIEGYITVNQGGKLLIEPNAVIKFKNGYTISVYGSLQASGAILTSFYDDAYGGDTNGDGNATQPGGSNYWSRIDFKETSTNSFIENTRMQYVRNGIVINECAPKIINNMIVGVNSTYSGNIGIEVKYDNASPEISGNSIQQFYYPLWLYGPNQTHSLTGPNSVSGNQFNGIYISTLSKSLTINTTWTSDLPYIISHGLSISPGITLTLQPGTIIKMPGNSISINGTLLSQGDSDQKVIITSLYDDEYGGDTNGDGNATLPGGDNYWSGISFWNDSTNSVIENTLIRYVYNGIKSTNGGSYRHFTDNVVLGVEKLNSIGIEIPNATSIQISGNTIQKFHYPLWLYNPDMTNALIGVNTLTDNQINGIYILANNGTANPLTTNATWTADYPYVLSDAFFISSSATLNLEPGTIIKMLNSDSIYVSGTLRAKGTLTDKIVLTSLYDDEYGGDTNGDGSATQPGGNNRWSGITFYDTSTNSVFENTIVRSVSDGLKIDGSSPLIKNSIIEGVDSTNSSNIGIEITYKGLSPQITGNAIQNFYYPIYLHNPDLTNALTGPNALLDNQIDGIYILANSGTANPLTIDASWTADSPYVLSDTLWISSGATLDLEPGTIIKMLNSNSIYVSGTLRTEGTLADKIVFTSLYDDEYGGDTNGDGSVTQPGGDNRWSGITFYDTSTDSILKYTLVRYTKNQAINISAPVTIQNSEVKDITGVAISAENYATPTITGNTLVGDGIVDSKGFDIMNGSPTITDNIITGFDYGIYCNGSTSEPVIHDNLINGNISYGIWNNYPYTSYRCPTIDATNNDWGDPSGPLDDSDDTATGGWYNPTGLGDKVSDYVNYQPWGTAPVSYVVSGVIQKADGTGVAGVTLAGFPEASTTDASGYYMARVPIGWTGTVTPNKAGYAFTPANIAFPAVTDAQPDQNYTAAIVAGSYTISGYVRETDNTPLADVVLDGFPTSPSTDANGFYTTTVDAGWSGLVTPHKAGYVFDPPATSYNAVTTDLSDQNYTTTIGTGTYTISGYIGTDSGIPIADVALSGFPTATTTNGNGYYSATVDAGWSGTITPELEGYYFAPQSREYAEVTTDMENQHYILKFAGFISISGYVRYTNGDGLPQVTLHGLPGSITTNSDGYYTALVDDGWSGTVTPQKIGLNFTPANMIYTNLETEQTDQDYTADEAPDQSLTIMLTGAGTGSVTSTPTGIDCGSTCIAPFSEGSLVSLTPQAESGSVFAGWTGECGDAGGTTCVVTMDAAQTITAQFNLLPACTLVTLSMYSNVGTDIIETGTDAVQAYVFPDWDTSLVDAQTGTTWLWSSNPPTADEQQNGARRTFRESFSVSGGAENISGTISVAGDDLIEIALNGNILVAEGDTCGGASKPSCFGSVYTYTFTPTLGGNLLDFAAINLASTVFNPAGIIYEAEVSFDLCPQTLTVSKTGTGTGTVSGTDITCGSDCVGTYVHGTDVILTATPDVGSMFVEWSGACVGAGPCIVTMDGMRNVTAEFAPLNACTRNTITVFSDVGTPILETGTNGVATSGSSDWNTTLVDFPAGTTWLWSSATPTTDEQINGAQRTFRETFTIPDGAEDIVGSVLVAADDFFSVALNGEVVTQNQCGGVGFFSCFESLYNSAFSPSIGQNDLDLTVTNAPWVVFNPAGIIYRADIAYSMCSRTLTIASTGGGTGTITGTGIDCGTDCEEGYNYGEIVTLTATPEVDSTFAGWSGGGCSGIGPCVVTMDAAKTVTATFYAGPLSRYVAPDGSDLNNACVESASPCQTIQYAIDVANAGDTVVAAAGTYLETITLKAEVSVTGAGAGVSIIDANRTAYDFENGNGPGPVVTAIGADITDSVVLSGFTMMGGSGYAPNNFSGGGIYVADGASLVISNNTIADNVAGTWDVMGHGGGIYVSNASPLIENNIIRDNFSRVSGSSFGGDGCGIYAANSDSIIIRNNTIQGNQGMGAGSQNTSGGGGIFLLNSQNAAIVGNSILNNVVRLNGGGIAIDTCASLEIRDNVITGNSAYYGKGGGSYIVNSPNLGMMDNTISDNGTEGYEGGGLYLLDSPQALLTKNTIMSNGLAGVGNCKGGGMFISGSTFTAINNNISNNTAYSGTGSGIYIYNASDSSILHNTVATNSGSGMGGYAEAMYIEDSMNVTIKNSIFWNALNQDSKPMELSVYGASSLFVTHSTIQGGEARIAKDATSVVTWAEGNLDIDPAFVAAASGNYHLAGGSVCIGMGDPSGIPADDIEGNPRPQPAGSNPDMGAYENQSAIAEISVKYVDVELPNSTGTYDFGSVLIGEASSEVTFSIENNGDAALSLTNTASDYVVISGPLAGDFSMSQQPASPILPGSSSSFRVQFSPTAEGPRTAVVSIANSDSDDDPYEFTITGTGQSACTSPLTAGRHEETDPDITYTGSWMAASGSGASGGTFTYTNDPTAEVSFCFTGTGFTLSYTGYSNRGDMEVCVDGSCETPSQYSATLAWQQAYSVDGLSAGDHTVTVRRVSGYIDLDAVAIVAGALPACTTWLTVGLYEETVADIAYTGAWTAASGSGASGGAFTYTNAADGRAAFCFTGTEVTLYHTGYTNRGDMAVCVDGSCQTVSQYRSALTWQTPYTVSGLSAGNHTVTVSRESGYIDLDAVRVGSAAPTCLTDGLHQETAAEITYDQPGNWVQTGSVAYTNVTDALAWFSVCGTGLKLYYTGYTNRGDMEVCVDAVCETVSQYRPTLMSGESYLKTGLSDGEHAVTIRRVSGYIDLDAVEVNPTPACTPLAVGLHQETAAGLTYTGTWTPSSGSGASGGALTYTNGSDATAAFCFSGSAFTLYYTGYTNRGMLEVCVDGSACETENQYRASLLWQQPYTRSGLTAAAHTVTLRRVSGYVDVDAVEIPGGSTVLGAGLYQETDSRLTYTGVWTPSSNASANGGTLRYTTDASGQVSFTIDGTALILYRTLYTNRGDMQVCVDGSCQTVSNYSATLQWNQPYTVSGLSAGEHAVTVSRLTNYVDLDAIEVQDTSPLMTDEQVSESVVTIQKVGPGQGTIVAGEVTCGLDCTHVTLPYTAQQRVTLTVIPEPGALFVGWQTPAGQMLDDLYYAQPGDTVQAVFELE